MQRSVYVYLDESGKFSPTDDYSLIGGFAYECDPGEPSDAHCRLIRDKLFAGHGYKDMEQVHSTADAALRSVIGSQFHTWFSELNDEDAGTFIPLSVIVKRDTRFDYSLNRVYEAALLETMYQIVDAYPADDIHIFAPTRVTVFSAGDTETKDIYQKLNVPVTTRPGSGTNEVSLNIGAAFVQIKGRIDKYAGHPVDIQLNMIDYSNNQAGRIYMYGYYMADWMCAWQRQILNNVSGQGLAGYLAVKQSCETLMNADSRLIMPYGVYTESYRAALTGTPRGDIGMSYIEAMVRNAQLADNPYYARLLANDPLRFADESRRNDILRSLITMIDGQYYKPADYQTAFRYFTEVSNLLDDAGCARNGTTARLYEMMMCCCQHTGNVERSKHYFELCKGCMTSVQDQAGLFIRYVQTYLDSLRFAEAAGILSDLERYLDDEMNRPRISLFGQNVGDQDLNRELLVLMAKCCSSRGQTEAFLMNGETAERYFTKALEIFQNRPFDYTITLGHCVHMWIDRCRADKACCGADQFRGLLFEYFGGTDDGEIYSVETLEAWFENIRKEMDIQIDNRDGGQRVDMSSCYVLWRYLAFIWHVVMRNDLLEKNAIAGLMNAIDKDLSRIVDFIMTRGLHPQELILKYLLLIWCELGDTGKEKKIRTRLIDKVWKSATGTIRLITGLTLAGYYERYKGNAASAAVYRKDAAAMLDELLGSEADELKDRLSGQLEAADLSAGEFLTYEYI